MLFLVLFEDRDKEALNGKGLSQSSRQFTPTTVHHLQCVTVILGFLAPNYPGDEHEIGSNADDSVGHQRCTKLLELDDQSKHK